MANEYKNGEDSEFDGGFFSGAGKDVLHSDIKIDVDDDNYPDRPLDEIEVISEENIIRIGINRVIVSRSGATLFFIDLQKEGVICIVCDTLLVIEWFTHGRSKNVVRKRF